MNLPINCASTNMSKNFAAMWMFLFYIFNAICAGSSVTITSLTCGEEYDMDLYNSKELTHSGEEILYENPCSVEFTKTSYKQYLCISASNIQLDCSTSLEYHEGFVKNYIDPEVKMSCNSKLNGEWCPSQYQDNIFIVIRKSSRRTSDDIRLRVYIKDVSEEDSDRSFVLTIILSIIVPVALVIMCSCICVIIRHKSERANAARTQIAYQTTAGAINIQAGQANATPYPPIGLTHPNSLAYPPVQGLQGNYNIHPMQSAYPAQQGATSWNPTRFSQQGNPGQNYSSGPPMDISAPPPSYESLVNEKS